MNKQVMYLHGGDLEFGGRLGDGETSSYHVDKPHILSATLTAKGLEQREEQFLMLDVLGENGVGRFWFRAGLNKQGRPYVEVTTKSREGDRETTKSVTGSWK